MQKALTPVNSQENDCFADDAVEEAVAEQIKISHLGNAQVEITFFLKINVHVTKDHKGKSSGRLVQAASRTTLSTVHSTISIYTVMLSP